MSETLERVMAIVSKHSGVRLERLNGRSAIAQDVRISGDDIDELAEALGKEFGEQVLQWPWQRFVELNEPSASTVLWFLWRLITSPVKGRLFDPNRFERLELGRIAAVLDRGEWFEP